MQQSSVISFKNKTIPVQLQLSSPLTLRLLYKKLNEMEMNFEFRKKLKRLITIEMVNDVAIFKYSDGTKLYLGVS
jgi:hypothetical protein